MGRPESLFAPARSLIASAVVVLTLRAGVGAAIAVAVGVSVDRLAAGGTITGPVWVIGFLVALRALLGAVFEPIATRVAASVEGGVRRRLVATVVPSAPRWDQQTGEVVAEATEGVEAVGALAGTFLPKLIGGMVIPVLLVAVVASIDPVTALVLLLIVPMIPALLRMMEKRFSSVTVRYRATADRLAARFLDGIQGMRTLQTLDQEAGYGDRLATEAEELRKDTMRLLLVNQLAILAVDALFTLGTVVAAAAMAAIRASSGAITMGEAVAIVLLGALLIEPLAQIGRYFYVGAMGRGAARRLEELFAVAGGSARRPAAGPVTGEIVFDDVVFRYPNGQTAIDRVSFSIRPGERIALVGPSGAGKSTLVHLVLGLLEPDSGSITVGGRTVLVSQRPFLFSGSVADNLRLAEPSATVPQMWAALEAAELAEAVRERADGLETQIGERGVRMSGGEAQRLAIARALLVDAPIVVLDEPTSSIDLETEARIRSALDRLLAGRTVVVIAHRRSTVEGAGRRLVLENGRLRSGTAPGVTS